MALGVGGELRAGQVDRADVDLHPRRGVAGPGEVAQVPEASPEHEHPGPDRGGREPPRARRREDRRAGEGKGGGDHAELRAEQQAGGQGGENGPRVGPASLLPQSVDQQRHGREQQGQARRVVLRAARLHPGDHRRAHHERRAEQGRRRNAVRTPDRPARRQREGKPAEVQVRREELGAEREHPDRVQHRRHRRIEGGERLVAREVQAGERPLLHPARRVRHVVPERVRVVHPACGPRGRSARARRPRPPRRRRARPRWRARPWAGAGLARRAAARPSSQPAAPAAMHAGTSAASWKSPTVPSSSAITTSAPIPSTASATRAGAPPQSGSSRARTAPPPRRGARRSARAAPGPSRYSPADTRAAVTRPSSPRRCCASGAPARPPAPAATAAASRRPSRSSAPRPRARARARFPCGRWPRRPRRSGRSCPPPAGRGAKPRPSSTAPDHHERGRGGLRAADRRAPRHEDREPAQEGERPGVALRALEPAAVGQPRVGQVLAGGGHHGHVRDRRELGHDRHHPGGHADREKHPREQAGSTQPNRIRTQETTWATANSSASIPPS